MIVLLKIEIAATQLDFSVVILRTGSCLKVPEHLCSRFACRLFDFSILRLCSDTDAGYKTYHDKFHFQFLYDF